MGGAVHAVTGAALAAVVALAGGAPGTLDAQAPAATGVVEGRITEIGTGRPLEAAQVVVVGTTLGAASNSAGVFRISAVPARQLELRIRLIGFAPATRTVTVAEGQTARLDVQLQTSALQLDQVVVSGTAGAVETKKLGNTIAVVKPPELAPIVSASEILQGREPGLVGLPSGGMTGEGARIRIRGNASITQSNEPIIFVDGIRINSSGGFGGNISRGGGSPSRLDDIDPASIERVEILKGAAAATLYGTEASNGVIQIFTKKGSDGRPRWNFSAEQIASQFPTNRLMTTSGYASTQARADSLSIFYGRQSNPIRPFEVITTSPLRDALTGTGTGQVFNGQVTGGTSTVTYFVSGRYAWEDGPLTGELGGQRLGPAEDVARRTQATANVTFQPRANLRMTARSSYTGSFQETPSNSNDITGFVSLAYLAKPETAECRRAVQLNPALAPSYGLREARVCDGPGNPFGNQVFATIREGAQLRTRQDVQRFIGAFDSQLDLPGNLTWTATGGIDITDQRSSSNRPFGNNVDGIITSAINGTRTIDNLSDRQITVDSKLRWRRDLGSSFAATVDAGVQGFFSRSVNSGATAQDFPGPGLEVVGAGTPQTIAESYLETVNGGFFGQVQFDMWDWVYPTVGGRYDYASAFGEQSPGVFYPKVSLSVVPSDRPGWDGSALSRLFSTVRLRGALGRSGRQPGAYDQFTTFQSITINPSGTGLVPSNLGNDDLAPEISTEIEAGFELGLLDDRFGINVTGWNRVVNDLLVPLQYPPSGGFIPTQLTNVGQMKARGLELGLNGVAFSRPNLHIDLFANGSYLWQEVTDLGGSLPIKVSAGGVRYRNFIREGYAPGALFGAEIIRPCAQRPSGASYRCLEPGQTPYDLNNDKIPDSEAELLARFATPYVSGASRGVQALLPIQIDQTPENNDPLDHYLGKPWPNWSGSFGGNMTIRRNWRLATLFEYRAGDFAVTNMTRAFQNSLAQAQNSRGTAETDAVLQNPSSTAQQRLDAALRWANELKGLSPYDGLNQTEKGDFLRWRELGVTYTAPQRLAGRIGASDVALSFTVRNLALWTGYTGVDPESNQAGRGGNTGVNVSNNNINQNFAEAVDVFGLPLQRRFTFAVRVGF